jgi:16S rRNA (guanine527-N7)-methyltransferase
MDKLVAGARGLGLSLTDKQIAAFEVLYKELVSWNAKFNLTAITDYEQAQIRHFVDSLSCLMAIRKPVHPPPGRALRCIDVGSGAGFPGIPLKIYCPQIQMVLLEATGKKVTFMEHVIDTLGLQEIAALKGRAEETAQEPLHREQYDVVFARAVADLAVLAEYTIPFCALGGVVVAQKGASAAEEIQRAEHAISILGGQVQRVIGIELVGLAEARNLVVIEKVARTPVKYPRRPGMPAKRPLQRE